MLKEKTTNIETLLISDSEKLFVQQFFNLFRLSDKIHCLQVATVVSFVKQKQSPQLSQSNGSYIRGSKH